jgi:heptose I phosphotransferase
MRKSDFKELDIGDLFSSDDLISEAKNIEGEVFREYENRVTKRIKHNDQNYFLKFHGPVGWKEIIKNLILLKPPILGATQEYLALSRMNELGINGPKVKYYHSKGFNPSNQSSFLITKELKDTISLEDFFLEGKQKTLSFEQKNNLLNSIANITRKLHQSGINHRDLYLCHYHLDTNTDFNQIDLSLIDLHRAQIRNEVPERWLVKDIGGLYHSAIQFGLTERDCYRFLMIYFNCSLRDLFSKHHNFLEKARSRAFSMYMKPLMAEIDISSEEALSNRSLYKRVINKDFRWIGLRNKVSEDLLKLIQDEEALLSQGVVIKDEEGHLVVKIKFSGRSLFIKKYRIKNLFHMIRKFFTKTRARNSWEALHWFNSVGIRTMQPVLIYEELGLSGALNSVLVTEEIEGKRLDYEIQEKEEFIKTASSIYNFFKRMKWIGFHHGDAKSSNFYISRERLVVFDLDSSKRHSRGSLVKKIEKDKKRILRSLEGSTEITEALKLRFKGK